MTDQEPSPRSRRYIVTALASLVVLLILTACSSSDASSPLDATDAVESEESDSDTQVLSATASATPSSIATEEPALEPTAEETIPPTENPLPENGAQFEIEDEPVLRMFRADDRGRTIYAATADGLWRSNDGGIDWNPAGDLFRSPAVTAINEPNVIYTGDKGDCGRGISSHDFLRTTDAGRDWEAVEENADIQPLLAYESQQDAILFGTNCGLSLSSDGGNTWRDIPDLAGEEIFEVVTDREAPLEQLLVVAVTEGGMGRLFLLDTENPLEPDLVGAITQFFGSATLDWRADRIAIATVTGVGVSDDLGGSWTWSRDGLESTTLSADPLEEGIPESGGDPYPVFSSVVIDPENLDRIWVGGNQGAFQSDDGGETWDRLGSGAAVDSIVVSRLTNRVFISGEDSTRIWALDES